MKDLEKFANYLLLLDEYNSLLISDENNKDQYALGAKHCIDKIITDLQLLLVNEAGFNTKVFYLNDRITTLKEEK